MDHTGRELGRIRTRVREICRDGAELLEGGKRTMSPDRWQRVVVPNYQAYEATLIGGPTGLQVSIARDELAVMKREILVYAEEFFPTLTCPECGAATLKIPCPRCVPPVVEIGDHNAQRARLLARFAREVQGQPMEVPL